ncbi:MAG: peptidylprolyl isomerase [Epsilonproteobacteria bacterium]|nr:peptidylprolyl isomerase [Campylobacterota bacterium]
MKKIVFAMLILSLSLFASKDIVILQTNQGNIELQLFPKVAPKACENFTTLVNRGYYDGIIFHRVIKNFMIQSGDPTGTGRGGESIWGHPFKDEFKSNLVFDKPFYLAMANRGKNTNGSQFFITTVPTPWLNGGYTIFGKVISGFDTVMKIQNTKTGARSKPIQKQYIIKAKLRLN